jgi:hypothetical protein
LDVTLLLDQLPDEEFLEIALYSVFEGLECDIKVPTKKRERRKTQELGKKDIEINLDELTLDGIDELLKSLEGGMLFFVICKKNAFDSY